MSTPHPTLPESAHEAARALVAQREQLQSWLAQLDSLASDVPGHVAARVRQDYLERLARVSEELLQHRDALEESLRVARDAFAEAEALATSAADELAEARLRHLIGELPAEQWAERQPALERGVEEAEAQRAESLGEVRALEALVAEVSGAGGAGGVASAGAAAEGGGAAVDDAPAAAEPPPADGPEATDEVEADDEALPWLTDADLGEEGGAGGDTFDGLDFLRDPASREKPEEAAARADDDLAFLEELDRAIAASAATPPTAPAAAPELGAAELPPKNGLVCKECGASNDARAWYCEICGMELT